VKPGATVPDSRRELEGREEEEKAARQDVKHRQEGLGAEAAVEANELRPPLRRQRIVAIESGEDLLPGGLRATAEVAGIGSAADDRGETDRDEEHDSEPQGADDRGGRQAERWLAELSVHARLRVLRPRRTASTLQGPGPAAEMYRKAKQ
jgi:hypothetical protein